MIPAHLAASRRLAALLLAAALAGGAPARAEEPTPELPDPPPRPVPEAPAEPAPEPEPAKPDVKRVIYLPESLKAEIKEQIRREVLETALRDGWAVPGQVPEWVNRFRPLGDVRVRLERDMFPSGNANTGDFPDFNAINTGAAVDYSKNLADLSSDRFLDVDQSRTRPRLRARLGVDVDVAHGYEAGFRLTSGESASPVSSNQTLGGSGGLFSRYQVWVDRAYLRWTPAGTPVDLAVVAGRFDNPFQSTELIWNENVNLDGLAVHWGLGGPLKNYLNVGAFPLYTTSPSFPSDATAKLPSSNRWLYAAQLGAGFTPVDEVALKAAVAFYDFDRVEGRPSTPCDTSVKGNTCDTDDTRPSFAQKGNTYRTLRTPNDRAIVQEALGAPEYQYFGLASRFHELTARAQVDLRLGGMLGVRLEGEWVRNLGFDRAAVAEVAINNLGACHTGACPFVGGDQGFLGRLVLSSLVKGEPGAWTATATYRHIESDATLDAFTDADFGMGGTNLKGFTAATTVVIARGVSLGLRWLGASAVAGPTYKVDVLQLDLQARL